MSDLLTVVLWLWGAGSTGAGWRPVYTAENVNIAARMIGANLSLPHRIVCITDMPEGIRECETVPLWDSHKALRTVREGGNMGTGKPNCFRRLELFDPDFRQRVLGSSHMLHMDLDVVITGSLDPLISSHDFRIMHGYRVAKYNGSIWMLRGAANRHVIDTFDPHTAPALIKAARMIGSDQGWISLQVPSAATYTVDDGCYQYMRLTRAESMRKPENMRVCFFAGGVKPWSITRRRGGVYLQRHYAQYAATPRKSGSEATKPRRATTALVPAVPNRTLRAQERRETLLSRRAAVRPHHPASARRQRRSGKPPEALHEVPQAEDSGRLHDVPQDRG